MRYYIVDAFTDTLFHGNQAGVCVLDAFPPDDLMQSIARENNLSETAFAVREGGAYALRWFTPAIEIDLCGHATLATAYVLFSFYAPGAPSVTFHTRSGALTVTREGDRLVMDFPVRTQSPVPVTDLMRRAANGPGILSAYGGYNLMLELADEEAVRSLAPDIEAVKALDYHGVMFTAPGRECDFVSRFFAPGMGINEDPVTGSTHTSLVPYWADRLGKTSLTARQLSRRGGALWCTLAGDRVHIGGQARLYLTGEILPAGSER